MFNQEDYKRRMAWFQEDRFGMFIHFGLYAIPARGEWVRNWEQMPKEDYQPFFEEFNPVDLDMKEWARIAKDAGMRYAVLTSKHHDGFCLFDSKLTDYKVSNTPYQRDIVREFLEAFRAEGIKVGLYFSLIDWQHPDFPHYGDRHHPARNDKRFEGKQHNFDRYLDYMHGQVEELCRDYGKLDLLWFDFSYDELSGEGWRGSQLVDMVRRLQPDIILNNRLGGSGEGYGSLMQGNPSPYSGDFVCPEQIIPPDGMRDIKGKPVVWEACITMNNHWGYNATDKNFKPADMLVRKLVECVSKDGNLLLNVGPDARGRIPEESVMILAQIGRWMHDNSRSIYGCGAASLQKPDFGRVTQNKKKLYFHVMDNPIGYVRLEGLKAEQVEKARLLKTGHELRLARDWITDNYPNDCFVSFGPSPLMPDPMDTVIEVTLK